MEEGAREEGGIRKEQRKKERGIDGHRDEYEYGTWIVLFAHVHVRKDVFMCKSYTKIHRHDLFIFKMTYSYRTCLIHM